MLYVQFKYNPNSEKKCKEKAMIFILHPTTANLQKTKNLQRTTHKYVLTLGCANLLAQLCRRLHSEHALQA